MVWWKHARSASSECQKGTCYPKSQLCFRCPLRVSNTQAEELIQAYRVATARKDFDLAKRIQCLLLVSSGMAERQAAEIVGVKRRTLQEWIFKYRRGGLAALEKGPYPGRSPKLTKAQLEELGRIIEQGPESVGLDSGVWTDSSCRGFGQ